MWKHFSKEIINRNKAADYYNSKLCSSVQKPKILPENLSVYGQYVVEVEKREELQKYLKEKEEKYYPTLGYSLKPFVLLFDEIYTDLYRIGEAQQRMIEAKKMVFMGTSFSVNITAIALRIAASNSIDIEIIDPNPIDIGYKHATYFEMSALEYVESFL